MSDVRRKYNENFKKNAVKRSDASNKSVSQVAQDLGISNGMLYRWRQKDTAEGDKNPLCHPGGGDQGDAAAERGVCN